MLTLLYIGYWPVAKFIGFVLFLLVMGIAFWTMTFLAGFIVPYWITFGAKENKAGYKASIAPEDVRRKILLEQDDVIIVSKK